MEISLGLYPDAPAHEVVRTARLAEAWGFACVWLADSHLLWREPYVLLGAIAANSVRIRLATCVTNPLTRHPSVTAAAFVTLAELSGGRAVLGISVGDSALRTMGMQPASMARLSQCIGTLRTLLAGQRAELAGGHAAKLAYAQDRPIPIAVAASGPRMLRLAGALADTVVLMNGVAPELIAAASTLIDDGARQAGRDPARVRRVVWAACHVSDDDPQRSLAMCKYNVARAILRSLPGVGDARTLEVAQRVRERYDYARHGSATAGFAALIPDDMVPRFTFAGTAADVCASIERLAAIGIDEVALAVPLDPDSAGRERVIERIVRCMPMPTHVVAPG
jgi:5,10-methylenetetrahydromethanopterin reductase